MANKDNKALKYVKILFPYVFDWAVIYAIWKIKEYMYNHSKVFERQFSIFDETISHPGKPDTLPWADLLVNYISKYLFKKKINDIEIHFYYIYISLKYHILIIMVTLIFIYIYLFLLYWNMIYYAYFTIKKKKIALYFNFLCYYYSCSSTC